MLDSRPASNDDAMKNTSAAEAASASLTPVTGTVTGTRADTDTGPGAGGGASATATAAPQRSPIRGIALIALAAFGLEMAVSAQYGYHRDELYFLAAGQHPAFGYVDQPPLTPLLARLSVVAFGNNLVGVRVLPALALVVLIVLAAVMSRLLGAGRTGQLLAALATAACSEYIGTMHLLTTTAPDFVAWGVTLLLVLRLLDSQDPRWWLAIGTSVGIGLEAKWNIGFLAAGLTVGFLATDARRLLRNRYLVLGCAIAVAIAAPDVIWQAMHGWPNLQIFHALQGSAGQNRAYYLIAQVVYTSIAATPVWIAGLVWTLRNQAARRFRPVGIACLVVIVFYLAAGGKAYYPGGVFTFLFAAGAVPLERWLAARKARAARLRPAALMGVVMVAAAVIAMPVALPVLPAAALHSVPLQKINYDLAETIGWPKEVALIAREYDALPGPQRRLTTILAGNYGEAGAVSRYRAVFGLPQVYSGANNFWLWGPPPAADTNAVAINVDPALLRREFASVRQVATFQNGLGVQDDEEGSQIFIATGLKSSWASAWPAFRNYS
jgi:4-amino-4-deoxy-L-arabinose transferase-like glycosyltransferase